MMYISFYWRYEIDVGVYAAVGALVVNYYDTDGGFAGSCNDSFRVWYFEPEA